MAITWTSKHTYIKHIRTPINKGIWTLKENKNDVLVALFTVLSAFLLILQPDASQLTAFAIPMMIILFYKTSNRIYAFSLIGILLVLVITSWVFLDALSPVTYVEEILALVIDMGLIWSILGILSLILLPLPFFLVPMANRKIVSRCLGLYFAIVIITTFFGNFPVPVMGYGISPMIGYLVAIIHMTEWPILTKNLFTFCATAPLVPLAFAISKLIKVEFSDKTNPLNQLGLLFSLNQMLYLLIAMWVYAAVPDKMVMVLAIVFGAHLLPYAWLYSSKIYGVMSIAVPISALIVGNIYEASALAILMVAYEICFSLLLLLEVRKMMRSNKVMPISS